MVSKSYKSYVQEMNIYWFKNQCNLLANSKEIGCSKIRKYEVHQYNLKPHAASIKRKSDKSIKPKTSIKTSATGFSVSLCTSNTLHSQPVLMRTHCCVMTDPEIKRKLKIGYIVVPSALIHAVILVSLCFFLGCNISSRPVGRLPIWPLTAWKLVIIQSNTLPRILADLT